MKADTHHPEPTFGTHSAMVANPYAILTLRQSWHMAGHLPPPQRQARPPEPVQEPLLELCRQLTVGVGSL